MLPIESIFYMVWRGVAIGILISAPMGPVGILCIQRTLDKGRKAGLFTGIGAAISDLFYCLLTGFGLSFIEDFINNNQNIIQLVGSIVLIAFSIYLFRKNPSSGVRKPLQQGVSIKKNILGGFLFTFSNPLIIFLIIGLFARFNFLIPEIKGYFYAVGYIFIIVGALAWWYGITFMIDKIRSRFNLNSMKKMNIAIGVVILGFALVGIISSVMGLISPEAKAAELSPEFEPGKTSFFYNEADTMMIVRSGITTDPETISDGILNFKFSNRASSPTKKSQYRDSRGKIHKASLPAWHILLLSDNDTIDIRIAVIEKNQPLSSQSALEFSINSEANRVSIPRYVKAYESGFSTGEGFNHLRLQWSDNQVFLRGGNRKLNPVFDGIALKNGNYEICFGIDPGGKLEIKQLTEKIKYFPSLASSSLSVEEIRKRLRATSDPLEREWQLLNINLNDNYLAEGGNYRIALIKAPDSAYDIIYLSGARINSQAWEKGMLKGRLYPSGLEGVFNVEWTDPFGDIISHSIKANLLSEDQLSIQFPYHESSITFQAL